MTYVEYLRKVYEIADGQEWPWLCLVAASTIAACTVAEYALASEHYASLQRTIHAHLMGHTFLPAMLREQRPDWPYAGADGKAIRLAWLTEQIELAEAEEAGACTPT